MTLQLLGEYPSLYYTTKEMSSFLEVVINYIPSIAHRWDFIGIKLHQSNFVAQLRGSEKSAERKMNEILERWLKSNAPRDEPDQWKELVGILRSPAVNLGRIAKDIESVSLALHS